MDHQTDKVARFGCFDDISGEMRIFMRDEADYYETGMLSFHTKMKEAILNWIWNLVIRSLLISIVNMVWQGDMVTLSLPNLRIMRI